MDFSEVTNNFKGMIREYPKIESSKEKPDKEISWMNKTSLYCFLEERFKFILICILFVGVVSIIFLAKGGYLSPTLIDNSSCISNITIPECPSVPECPSIPACACSPIINVNFTLPKNITT